MAISFCAGHDDFQSIIYLRGNFGPLFALQSVAIMCSMILYFGALGVMPAAITSSPIFVLVISATVLGMAVGAWRILAVLAGFVGVLMILRPGGDALGWSALMPIEPERFTRWVRS